MANSIDLTLINAIESYQRKLSPKKGFYCAHKSFYKGHSCSEHIKELIKTKGLRKSIKSIIDRFKECREAYYALNESEKNQKNGGSDNKNIFKKYLSPELCCGLSEASCLSLPCLFS